MQLRSDKHPYFPLQHSRIAIVQYGRLQLNLGSKNCFGFIWTLFDVVVTVQSNTKHGEKDNFKVLFYYEFGRNSIKCALNQTCQIVSLIVEYSVCNATYLEILVTCKYLTLVVASKSNSHKLKVFLISRIFTVAIKISIFQVNISCENSV